MEESLYYRMREMIGEYQDLAYGMHTHGENKFRKNHAALIRAIVLAYGDVGSLPNFGNVVEDSLPRDPDEEFVKDWLKNLPPDLTAHERAKLLKTIRRRWDAWCTIVGGAAAANAVRRAVGQLAFLDETAREETDPASGIDQFWHVGLSVSDPSKARGRPPVGDKALSNAERQRRYRQRRKAMQTEGAE